MKVDFRVLLDSLPSSFQLSGFLVPLKPAGGIIAAVVGKEELKILFYFLRASLQFCFLRVSSYSAFILTPQKFHMQFILNEKFSLWGAILALKLSAVITKSLF